MEQEGKDVEQEEVRAEGEGEAVTVTVTVRGRRRGRKRRGSIAGWVLMREGRWKLEGSKSLVSLISRFGWRSE